MSTTTLGIGMEERVYGIKGIFVCISALFFVLHILWTGVDIAGVSFVFYSRAGFLPFRFFLYKIARGRRFQYTWIVSSNRSL